MKIRILMLSLIGLIFFNSCSSDSDSSNSTSQNLDPNTILPKKIINEGIYSDGTYEFFYNQNKIDYIKCSAETEIDGAPVSFDLVFTYTGNLITKIQTVNGGQEFEYLNFTYQNNKLVNKKYTYDTTNGSGITTTVVFELDYVYNSNNTISVLADGILKTTYTLSEDQSYILKREQDEINYSEVSSSPFKNILGIKESFLDMGYYFGGAGVTVLDNLFASSASKNITSLSQYNISGIYFQSRDYSYSYNELLFPTTIIEFRGNGGFGFGYDSTSHIFYQ
jgi:hypothetical protein